MASLQNLYGFDRAQLEQLFVEQGLQAFRGRQLMKWVYHQGKTNFADMTDLPLAMREWLGTNCHFSLPEIERQLYVEGRYGEVVAAGWERRSCRDGADP